MEKPEVKGPLGRYMHKLEDNIKMDNEEIEQEDVEWIYLFQDTVVNFQVPYKVPGISGLDEEVLASEEGHCFALSQLRIRHFYALRTFVFVVILASHWSVF